MAAMPGDQVAADAQQPTPLPAALQAILDDSERTPAGRSFYPSDDLIMREAARTLAPQDGYYVIDVHGTADRARVGSAWVEVDDLAALVRATPEWDGENVFLMSCESGRRPDGFAQQLADRLKVDVAAPDKLAWSDFDPGGRAQPYSSDGSLDASGVPRPVKPPTGTFVTFSPTDQEQATTDGQRAVEISNGGPSSSARLGLLHRQTGPKPIHRPEQTTVAGQPPGRALSGRAATRPGRTGDQLRDR